MRFLDARSYPQLILTKDLLKPPASYAILSHTWGPDEDEVTFSDLQTRSGTEKAGYAKLRFCAQQARRDGLDYFWVDTCCIDKSNLVELTEAIASMFRWYKEAEKCYVYLSDMSVPTATRPAAGSIWETDFRASRWFTRGWTLQELIAPTSVEFFSKEGLRLGDKHDLGDLVSDITGIPLDAIRGAPLTSFSTDERLRWAEGRQTTKIEDKAYCLLGIFGVFMSLIYGEGENAYIRLRREIDIASRRNGSPGADLTHQRARVQSRPIIGVSGDVAPDAPTSPSSRSAAATVTTQPVSTSSSRARHAWDQAYNSIITSEETTALVNEYSNALAEFVGAEVPEVDALAQSMGSLGLQDSAECHDNLKKLIDSWQYSAVHASKLTEKTGSVAQFLHYVRASVSEALQTDPQLALPWVGVSIGLEVLVNPRNARISDLEGLAYLTSRMRWYCALGVYLLSNDNIGTEPVFFEAVQNDLDTSIVALYRFVLLYQMETVSKYFQSKPWHAFRGRGSLDGCSADLASIVAAEASIQKLLNHHAKPRVKAHLKTLVQAAADTKARLGEVELTLGDFVTAQMNKTIDEHENAMLRALYVLDPRYDMANIEDEKDKLLDEAYNWILDTPEYARFIDWQHRASDSVRLMWIKGNAGTGKTMLLIGIIQHLSKQSSVFAPHLAYFFCRGTAEQANCDATACLRSLIWLLLFQQPHLRSHLLSEYRFKESGMFTDRNAFATLRGVFLNMLTDVNFTQAYLIVDALDECSERLDPLLELISTSLKATSRVKWLVSGRPEVDIARLRSTGTLVELDAQRLSAPVAAYIKHKIEDLADRDGYTPQIMAQISEEIKPRAQNTFLWVSLVFKELAYVDGWDATDVVKATPSRLLNLYDHIMAKVTRQTQVDLDRCKRLLATTTLAFRPLSLAELTILAGLPPGSAQTYVLRCRSFLMIKESDCTVHLIHQSVKQYLTANFTEKLYPSGFSAAHSEISHRSRTAVAKLRSNVYDLPGWGCARQDITAPKPDPLESLRYSCVFWGRHHVDAIHEIDTLHATFSDCIHFFETNFLVWLECLSLLDQVAQGVHTVRDLLRIAEHQSGRLSPRAGNHSASTQPIPVARLIELLTDAERFIISHRSVIEHAPLQTYASALVFSPSESTLRSHFWNSKIPEVASVTGIRAEWESCLQILEGHTGNVNTVTFSHHGKSFASASNDSTLFVWDSETGCHMNRYSVPGAWVTSVAFAPDNQMLASASSNGTVQLWNLDDGTCTDIFHSDTQWVTEIVFSRNGALLAGARTDSTVQLWNLNSGACQVLDGNGYSVNSLVLAGDGDKIMLASSDGSVYLWNIVDGTKETLQHHCGAVNAVAWSLDEACVASGSTDGGVTIHWPENGKTLPLAGHSDAVNAVAFSPSGLLLASGSSDGTLRLWSTTTGRCTKLLSGHQNWVNSVSFSPDGNVLASGSSDRTIRLWETNDGQQIRSVNEAHDGPVVAVTFSSDGQLCASASADRTVRLWDTQRDRRLWETKRGTCLKTFFGHDSCVSAIAFSNDCSLVATGSADHKVRLWSVATGALKMSLVGHLGPVLSLCFAPDDKHLISGASDWRARIWNVTSATCTQTLEGHQSWVTHVVFSADGTNIASASKDGAIRLWAPALGGQQLEKLKLQHAKTLIHITGQGNVALLPTKNVVTLWDGQTFACRAIFTASAPIWTLSFGQNDGRVQTDCEHFDFGPLLKDDENLEVPARITQPVNEEHDLFLSFDYPTMVGADPDWQILEQSLGKIFASRSVDIMSHATVKEYMSFYTAVHNICARFSGSQGFRYHAACERLYETLRDYLVEYLEELVRISSCVTGEALLRFYSHEWDIFVSSSRYVGHLFGYYDENWVRRTIDEGRLNVYKIFDLHLVLWYKVVVGAMRERIMSHILNKIKEQRQGARTDHKKIKDFVDSLIAIGESLAGEFDPRSWALMSLPRPEALRNEMVKNEEIERFKYSAESRTTTASLRYIYLLEVENPILVATKDFYKLEAKRLLDVGDVSEYLKTVEQRLDEEEERSRTYLHASTELPLKRVCTAALVQEQSQALLEAFSQFLRERNEEDMARMCRLFAQHSNGLAKLLAPFEIRLRKAGLANVLGAGSRDEKFKFGKLLSSFTVPGSGGPTGSFFIKDDWIFRGKEKILWLPQDYRPTCAAFHGGTLALGHQSGRVTFIEFVGSSGP